jgi:hypothetical protein
VGIGADRIVCEKAVVYTAAYMEKRANPDGSARLITLVAP